MKHKLKNKGGEYGELSEWSTRKKYVYVFLDFRVVIIKNGKIVEASFMMMNQVDSRCFDDNKRWWQKAQKNNFKNESTIQESREVNDFKIESNNSRIKRSLILRFKKRWVQVPREEIKKTSQGKYWKDFSKNKHSTVLFFKRSFHKIF